MKTKSVVLILFASSILLFSGCGDKENQSENIETLSPEVQDDVAENQEDSEIKEYEVKYAAGAFGVEDYKALAELYSKEDMRKKQRDLLEECYRLYDDKECLETLQGIVVNIAEESDEIREEAERMLMNMQTPEYLDEAAGMLISDDWIDIMMPVLREGSRKYYLTGQEGRTELCIEAGYDQSGTAYASVWLLEEESRIRSLMRSGDTIQMVETGTASGNYQGAFDLWLCMAESGDVYHEAGTFEKGVCVGDYTAQVRFGTEASDLFALWCNRQDMTMTDYHGNFNEMGITTVSIEEKEKVNITNGGNGQENLVLYAATDDKSNCLFINVPEDTEKEAFIFNSTVLGIDSYPQFTHYEPKEDVAVIEEEEIIKSGDVKVRVYDSRIQWFDGSIWHTLDDVDEYIKQDPFNAYKQRKLSEETENQEPGKSDIYKARGSAVVKKESADKPVTPSKKSDSKGGNKATTPTTPTAPAPSAVPKQVAPPTNAGGNDNNSGNSGGGSNNSDSNGGGHSGGDNGGGSNSGSGGSSGGDSGGSNNGGSGGDSGGGSDNAGSGGGSDSGGSNGGDTDIEWTDDIL